jgi:hypothetical protein
LSVNVAATVVAAAMEVTLQIAPLVDEQPDHPVKVYAAAGVAVSATLAPELTEVVQGKVVQLIPVAVTVPDPLACTVSTYCTSENVAVTVVPPAGTVTWQGPTPVQEDPENASVD